MVWSGAEFLIAGDIGSHPVQTSYDGITWTGQTPVYGNSMYAATWSGSQFVITGMTGITQRSFDGVSWSGIDAGHEDLYGATWFNNQFIVVGKHGIIVATP